MSCCLKPVTPKIHWDFKPQISSIHIDIFEAPFSKPVAKAGGRWSLATSCGLLKEAVHETTGGKGSEKEEACDTPKKLEE